MCNYIPNIVFACVLYSPTVNLFLKQWRDLLYKVSSAVVGFVENYGNLAQMKDMGTAFNINT